MCSNDKEKFHHDVVSGLNRPRKELPCKYLYDRKGALLFDLICSQEEYYIPSVEQEIMETNFGEIVRHLGSQITLVELGCGECIKTRLVLDELDSPSVFVPVDISAEQLLRVSAQLEAEYPHLELQPVIADYTGPVDIPIGKCNPSRVVVYFPGSTIGNFSPREALSFLERIAYLCEPAGALLIGVDLQKDVEILHRAYNDERGVTAAFNLNLLERINNELGGDFDLNHFDHRAFFNEDESRIEMHLVSDREQVVNIDGSTISFRKGESIHTESSYKFSLEGFRRIAAVAGFRVERTWTDERRWFSVQYLVPRR